jgi:hypothetical protein
LLFRVGREDLAMTRWMVVGSYLLALSLWAAGCTQGPQNGEPSASPGNTSAPSATTAPTDANTPPSDAAPSSSTQTGGDRRPSPVDPAQASKTGANAGEGASYSRSNEKTKP